MRRGLPADGSGRQCVLMCWFCLLAFFFIPSGCDMDSPDMAALTAWEPPTQQQHPVPCLLYPCSHQTGACRSLMGGGNARPPAWEVGGGRGVASAGCCFGKASSLRFMCNRRGSRKGGSAFARCPVVAPAPLIDDTLLFFLCAPASAGH